MNITILISCLNSKSNGLGGHYHSLLETVKQLKKEHEVTIVVVGNAKPLAFAESAYNIKYVLSNGFRPIKDIKIISKVVHLHKTNILWAFDLLAYYWVRILSHKHKIPCGLTKCGGKNQRYNPFTDNLVLFSSENLRFFRSQQKFTKTNLYLIPNRLSNYESDYTRIKKINEKLGTYKQSFKFLRITRIGTYYEKSCFQLIQLVNRLTKEGIFCSAIFIGTTENEAVLKKLKKLAGKNVFFFTSKEFTSNAKQLIDIADAVLGTGRSFMEAAAKGKVLLAPDSEGEIPILIDKNNFDTAFYYNFSERIKFKKSLQEENLTRLKRIISNKEKAIQYSRYSTAIFDRYFSSQKILLEYNKVYTNMSYSRKVRIVDFWLHTLFLLRKMI